MDDLRSKLLLLLLGGDELRRLTAGRVADEGELLTDLGDALRELGRGHGEQLAARVPHEDDFVVAQERTRR